MNLYVVGCGFTKALFNNAPLNSDLMSKLVEANSDSVSEILSSKYQTQDIEIALTRLDSEMMAVSGSLKGLQDLRNRIEQELAEYFNQYTATSRLVDEAEWLRVFIESTVKSGDVAISLNYDCVFEGALDCMGKWSPNGGYGHIDNMLANRGCSKSPVSVLKIHGSSSFKIAPTLPDNNIKSVNFIFNEDLFPVSARNKHFGYGCGMGRPYLIAPSYVKVPSVDIAYLMIDALDAAAQASNLVFIGCGLRPEDTFLTLLLTHFLRQQSWINRKIIVLDLNANEIVSRMKRYWGVNVDQCIVPVQGYMQNSMGELSKLLRAV